ncbi:MAG TPA: response regulator transcription factor [Pyrinomonadaceae bacterium]|nr:response regulator transcription factor [Pyrinomonadaceae bacterium]
MGKRILIVDDEAKLLKALAVTLRGEDYEVSTAANAAEALINMSKSLPDLIISDIRMPGMDGFQFAKALRQNARTDMIPIVFLTAKDERKDRLQGLRSGIDAYLTKPFDPEELLAVISNILSRADRMSLELARMVRNVGGDKFSEAETFMDEDFTEAESRIARFVADGLTNKEIAAELNISVRTVEGHISNILSKKAWSNRVEIARYVLNKS